MKRIKSFVKFVILYTKTMNWGEYFHHRIHQFYWGTIVTISKWLVNILDFIKGFRGE